MPVRRFLRLLALAAASWLAFHPGVALAAPSLASPVPDTHALTGFGETYSSGGATRVHSGLDLAADQGAPVTAACAGTVTFAGRLPSSDGDALGVTIETADGLKVTVSPLSAVGVHRGDAVEQGARVGTLAGQGDASSSEPHLHLSVRSGETYLDPAKMLQLPPPAGEPATVEQPAPVSQPAASDAAPRASAPPASAPAVAAPVAPSAAPAGVAAAGGHPAVPVSSPSAAPAVAARSVAPVSIAAAPVAGVHAAPVRGGGDGPDVASAVAAASEALAGRHVSRVLRHTSLPPSVSALQSLRDVSRRLAALETAAGAVVASVAFLWPIWRRSARPAVRPAEPAPVEVPT